MLAVDAGTHLAAIIKIFERHLPRAIRRKPPRSFDAVPRSPVKRKGSTIDGGSAGSQPDPTSPKLVLATGPFATLELPYESAKANASYLIRTLVSTYLITHPHLDHVSGFAVNTASFQHTSRPKRVAALPSTIDAIKDHIFNDVIWPNLSDEDGGVGLVSYMRLAEGGNVALGEGEGRGYIEVCDGLGVKCWSISHGHCMKGHSHHGNGHIHDTSYHGAEMRRTSRPTSPPMRPGISGNPSQAEDKKCVYDSSAFFIRDDDSGKEVLIFGDVEPDSISLSPRTARVWSDAAAKIVAGLLMGIFIECSYDDSQPDVLLFGHLCPRHLVAELQVLAEKVLAVRQNEGAIVSPRKRKRISNGFRPHNQIDSQSGRGRNIHQVRRSGNRSSVSPFEHVAGGDSSPTETILPPIPSEPSDSEPAEQFLDGAHQTIAVMRRRSSIAGLLQGVRIIIIHVKDTLKDGPHVSESILEQLNEYEKEVQLGCTFTISQSGDSIWL